jgi:hypothetical protein
MTVLFSRKGETKRIKTKASRRTFLEVAKGRRKLSI